nr:unnamed protein product [Spirometra erinaceieuropaei]
MVGPTVSTRDRLRHQHVPLISPPDEDVVQQVPLTRPRMPPGGLLSLRQTEEGVRQNEAVFCAGAEKQQSVVVGAAETMGPSTPLQAVWSVPTRALKSPRTINLSAFDTVAERACRSS